MPLALIWRWFDEALVYLPSTLSAEAMRNVPHGKKRGWSTNWTARDTILRIWKGMIHLIQQYHHISSNIFTSIPTAYKRGLFCQHEDRSVHLPSWLQRIVIISIGSLFRMIDPSMHTELISSSHRTVTSGMGRLQLIDTKYSSTFNMKTLLAI